MDRRVVATRTQADVTSGNACWETPPAVFAQLDQDFGPFDVDLTADPQRALCDVWFGPGSPYLEDALDGNWAQFDGVRGYSNPPYGAFVPKILRVAAREAAMGAWAVDSVFLLPMRVTKSWFLPLVLKRASHLYFCDKRVTFYEGGRPRLDGKGKPAPAMFDSILVRFGSRSGDLQVGTWHVPDHV